jgi:hypothetical protein
VLDHGCGVPNKPVVILPRPTTIAPVSVRRRSDAWRQDAARTQAVAENQRPFGFGVVHFDGQP